MNIEEIAGTTIRDEEVIKFPLSKNYNGFITDANGNHIMDIRGWGRIQYASGDEDTATALHEGIADWVVDTLNAEAARLKLTDM